MFIYTPYFYIIQEVSTGMYYAGSKYGKDAHPDNFMIEGGYMTYSNTIKNLIEKNGLNSFIIRKIKRFGTAKEAHNYETRFLRKVDARNHSRFYNKHNNDWNLYDNKNKVSVIDIVTGETFQTEIDDPRYIRGELRGVSYGMKPGVDAKTGISTNYELDDPRWETGEIYSMKKGKSHYKDADGNSYFLDKMSAENMNLQSFSKDKVSVKDKNGNYMSVNINDSRYTSGELVGTTTGYRVVIDNENNTFLLHINVDISDNPNVKELNEGMCVVKDNLGKILRVHKNDPRYISGELVGITKNKLLVRDIDDPNEKYFYIDKENPEYLSGKFIPIHKGKVRVKDSSGKVFMANCDDERLASGELEKHYKRGKYYTNGKNNKLISEGEEIPNGFYKGKTSSVKKMYYTNGNKNMQINEGDTPPEGYYRGMTVFGPKKKWFTNGLKNIKVIEGECPPKGFLPGKIHRKGLTK